MKTVISFFSALILIVMLSFYFTPENSKATVNDNSESKGSGDMIFTVGKSAQNIYINGPLKCY